MSNCSGAEIPPNILVVDDTPENLHVLAGMLNERGYKVRPVPSGKLALQAAKMTKPDLILLDLHMPGLDGFGVMEQLRPRLNEERYLPVLVVTADLSVEVRQRALGAGARDFLNKPFDAVEALLRIRNLLTTRFLYLQLDKHNRGLEATVQERTRKLEVARLEILERLALAAEFRDDNTGEHTRRVGQAERARQATRHLADDEALTIERAAPLHDVGKIGIRDAILLKAGALTAAEFQEMKRHTVIGADILAGSSGALLRTAETIALTHHERWDGTGYPSRLVDTSIPLAGRITHVADVFDAMTHPYGDTANDRRGEAIRHIGDQAGLAFDPDVVKAFLSLVQRESLRSFR